MNEKVHSPKVETLPMTDPPVTIQAVRGQFVTAVTVQQPRDLIKVETNCLMEAALAGERCYYGWKAGDGFIEGPSIELAMIAARNWGNSAVEMLPIIEDAKSYLMTAAFIDLENGTTITRQFRQSKTSIVYGKMDEERKADIRFQIGQSKAQRNVVLRALPTWLIDKMMDRAKQGVREKLERLIETKGIGEARELLLKEFTKHSVTKERIEAKYKKKVGAWDVELLTLLRGDLYALNSKVEEAIIIFPEVLKVPNPKAADYKVKKEGKIDPIEPKKDEATKSKSEGELPFESDKQQRI